jgi:hypothetical protein
VATLLTKISKAKADYQQWLAAEITDGDIIDVATSLGGRSAHTVTIESRGGPTTLRFNVAKKIYKEHGPDHNPYLGWGAGTTRPSPLMVAEVELAQPDIVVTAEVVQTWTAQEIAVSDIKVCTKSPFLKITVT